jgi:glycosyltransferase involved in cell wall biosynthesis
MSIQISVVMPTFNRWAQLQRVLEGYGAQSIGTGAFEVLVCDDASSDDTPAQVRAFAETAPYRLHYLRQEKKGPAAARNMGIAAASAPLVVLTDDDCVPHPEFLARHLASTRPGVATIGYIDWHPEITVTPFMAFLSPGYRFNFAQITDPADATFRCFYTANVSAWRSDLLAVGGFDEGFPAAAYEDIELGYRLHRAGIRLVYDREAIIFHLHEMRLEGMVRSQVVNGRSAAYAVTKHPALAVEAGVSGLRNPGVPRRFFGAALDYYFVAGLEQGLHGHFGGEWVERLEELLDANPAYRESIERQFYDAENYAFRLEERVAQLEAAHAQLADHTRVLEQALRAANPLKTWLHSNAPAFVRSLSATLRRRPQPAR